jgi:phosphoserine aminotransferase
MLQSKTVIVADCGTYQDSIKAKLKSQHLTPGSGYGPFKDQHLRFANFPAHSKEQFELLVDTLSDI